MRYQIWEVQPIYCGITDGLIGSSYRPLPMTYHVEALAHCIAGRLSRAEYEALGDGHFVVTAVGDKPWNRPLPPAHDIDLGECPF